MRFAIALPMVELSALTSASRMSLMTPQPLMSRPMLTRLIDCSASVSSPVVASMPVLMSAVISIGVCVLSF